MSAKLPLSLSSEIQKLAPDAVIELLVFDMSNLSDSNGNPGPVLYIHGGTNYLLVPIVWAGQTYNAAPLSIDGLEYNGRGQLPRPKVQISNIRSLMTALILTYGDPLGSKVVVRRTLAKFLDGVNFPGGANPTADPTAQFPDDIFFVNQRTVENREVVEFELAASFDFQNLQLPRRPIVQNVCVWRYRGAECGYTGNAYFDMNDNPVGSQGQDVCGKRLSSCKCRFGAYNQLPFGSFPAAGLLRL